MSNLLNLHDALSILGVKGHLLGIFVGLFCHENIQDHIIIMSETTLNLLLDDCIYEIYMERSPE